MAWPTRTGLTTAKKLAKSLKAILQKYQEWYVDNLTEEQYALITALIGACQGFIDGVPQYEPPA
jgi:hypothetical protein